MEEDDQSSASALCIRSHGEPAPQTSAHPSGFHSWVDARRSSACHGRGLTGDRSRCHRRLATARRRRANPSAIELGGARVASWERVCLFNNSEDAAYNRDQQQEGKTERLDLEKEFPEDSPPAKRWVIGPLFQSFRSKMASFTEIVMSPIRVFKSNNSPPPNAPSSHHEQLTGSDLKRSTTATEDEMDVGSDHKGAVQAKNLAQNKHGVVQRLAFDSDSSSVNNSEDEVKISPNGSECMREASSSSAVETQLAPTDQAGAVPSDAPSLEAPRPDSSHALTSDAHNRGQADNVVATLGMSTRTSPRKAVKNPVECVAVQDSESFYLEKAAVFSDASCTRKSVAAVVKPVGYVCKGRGSIPETSASCDSSEREKMGQACRSRTRRKRDVKSRASAALGVVNDTSDVSSSSAVTKGAVVNSTNVMGGSNDVRDGNRAGASPPAPVVIPDGPSGNWATTRKTRKHKNDRAVLRIERRSSEDLDVDVESHGVEPVVSPGPLSGAQTAGAGPPGASDLGQTGHVRRSKIRQVKHKLQTSNAASGSALLGPAAKKRAGTRAVQKDAHVFEEQRVSMSLTLQVGPEAHGNRDVLRQPAPAGPSPRCQAVILLKNCQRRRKGGAHASSTPELFQDVPLVPECPRGSGTPKRVIDELDGQFCKSDIPGRVEEMMDRKPRRRGVQEDQVEEGVSEAASSGSGSSRLLRSLSCPDIPSLQDIDHASLTPSHDKFLPSPHRRRSPAPPHAPAHCPYKRARRHTVCTVEIEREIAPLCLRKEVHPVGWARASGRLQPCSSLSTLASCFLSSPLAFLSRKSSHGWSDSRKSPSESSPPAFVVPPSASPLKFLAAPKIPVFPGPSACGPSSPGWASASVSSPCSVLEPATVVVDHDGVQCARDVADQPAFGPELPSRTVCEEKDPSHFEIKFQTDCKRVQHSKVSSIRIRKTRPKPQYNLTPMGLPKAVRIKKKIFSVEEIYTNKNFSQPPEGRLETIFEVPLSRRDGSQSLIGQKRVKRFVEFPELGMARKPRKPLTGAAAGVGGAQRKVGGNSATGRTRRGVWASSRDEDALNLQLELESLLCSKLTELDSWMALEQMAY